MIDEKGRLFGKVNIIDLLIILIVIAALVFVGVKIAGPDSTVANTQKAIVSFYYEECPDFVSDQLVAGDVIWDSADNVNMGTVLDWTRTASVTYMLAQDKSTVLTSKDGYSALTLRCEAQGAVSDHGITINGTLYGVGHSLTIYAGKCKMYLKVSGIEPVA